ncbi:MAG: class I SAM-dependent methyltransferase, partial [Desulfovermiculus sp.]|nr:class I SAM-dependent methyltransferase [Desulfovermiculus sp.]
THHAWYSLIVNDPLRVEEELLFQEFVLDHYPSKSVPLRIADLGTGNGRLAFGLSDMLRNSTFHSDMQFIGLDLGISNLRDGLRLAQERDMESAMHPLLADMTHLPLQTGVIDIMCASSSLNLIAEYGQPLVLLEMMRCLKEGGEVLITGPNESFSAENYVKCAVATNLEEYLLPWNMLEAHNLGQPGMVIDELSRNRCDFSYLKTDQIWEAAHSMGCKPIYISHWPRCGATREIYSGIRFRVTSETKRRIQVASRNPRLDKKKGIREDCT